MFTQNISALLRFKPQFHLLIFIIWSWKLGHQFQIQKEKKNSVCEEQSSLNNLLLYFIPLFYHFQWEYFYFSAFHCHPDGSPSLLYAPQHQLLLSSGRRGEVCLFDLRQRQLRHTFQAHDSAVRCMALHPMEEYFITGAADGDIKVKQSFLSLYLTLVLLRTYNYIYVLKPISE